jgi:hypothetical protein
MSKGKDSSLIDSDSSSILSQAPQKDSLKSFISTLATFSGDLSALTCPSFLLSSVSLLEYRQATSPSPLPSLVLISVHSSYSP